MKKYLIIILMIFTIFFISCKDENPVDENKPTEVENIEAIHQVSVDSDEVSPYVIVESVLNENNDLIYSLTYISIFPNNYLDNGNNVTLTGRFYDYYQVDYITVSGTYDKYFHQYDYLDGSERSYAQNFMPEYNFKEQLKTLKVLVKYRFTKNGVEESKQIKYQEEIIEFDKTKFNNNDLGKYQVGLIKNKNTYEDFNRYKISITLDETISTGHYDIQTWVEIKGNVYPFLGFYHYRPNHGNIYTMTDVEVSDLHVIDKIYYNIKYYSNSGEVEDIYYLEQISNE